jgi:feruloyl esterase
LTLAPGSRPLTDSPIALVAGLLGLIACFPASAAVPCESLTALAIAETTVTSAMLVPAGAPLAGVGRGRGGAMKLPAFCRVAAVSKPANDSEIHFEVWLPAAESWNGKFEGTGNGGYSGALDYAAMQKALSEGFATAGSDTGHSGDDLKFAVGHPGKIDDWGWRAVHTMTEAAKLVVRANYGRFAEHSYFAGCSTGGHQALMEAQRFPADYDGIAAGDPGNNRVRLNVGFLWSWLALYKEQGSTMPASKLPMINRAAIEACDEMDGVKDGLISEPLHCKFDPATLLCKGADSDACLTAPQVTAVQKIYDGAKNSRTGEQLFSGWVRGSELGWAGYFVGHAEPARIDFWRYWVFGDLAWDPRGFDFDKDVAWADTAMAAINSNNPDLKAFRAQGGKLLLYSGWADPVVPPGDVVRYYEAVRKFTQTTDDFFRLFMVPGMGHCNGGPGPSTFDALGALDAWATKRVAPEKIVASHSTNGAVDRTRPLCPYPQVARWKGTGSSDEASQFVCTGEAKPAAPAAKKSK